MSEIATKVVSIITDKLGVEESQVVPEASFTNIDKLFLGILRTLTGDSCMKLRHTSAVILGRVIHEIVTKRGNATHFRCIFEIPEVADCHQFSHTILHLPLVVADSRKGAA